MSLFPSLSDGYYDDAGQWQRLKFCFVSCGDACTCMPPGGVFYSKAHDKSKRQQTVNEAIDEATEYGYGVSRT